MKKICIYQALGGYVNNVVQRLKSSDSVSDSMCNNSIENAENLVAEHFPSGSGFDSGTTIEWDECKYNKIVLRADFHHIDDNGFYCGWSEHKIVIKPSFTFGYDLVITGKNRRGIKEYIGDIIHGILQKDIDV